MVQECSVSKEMIGTKLMLLVTEYLLAAGFIPENYIACLVSQTALANVIPSAWQGSKHCNTGITADQTGPLLV